MTKGTATTPSQPENRTIILTIGQEEYEKIGGNGVTLSSNPVANREVEHIHCE